MRRLICNVIALFALTVFDGYVPDLHGRTFPVKPGADIHNVDSTAWLITADKLFGASGKPLNSGVARLIASLESVKGTGVPVSRHEFLAMLTRPESKTVYVNEILKYATPVSVELQKKEHENYAVTFMGEQYMKSGLEFLRKQHQYLEMAEKKYGILKQDIVSLLTWESRLGECTGEFREFNVFLGQILYLDAAQKLAVKYLLAEGKPNPLDVHSVARRERSRLEIRKQFAVGNLSVLLRTCKQRGIDPFTMRGSWGGAIGNVQFMPVNLRYAVDGDGDGVLDLAQWPDAIMSAAHFLKVVGRYTPTPSGRRRAFLRYNPSGPYADGIVLVADSLWKRHLTGD